MSIYDIPSITETAFDVSITAKNISAGFAATGCQSVNTDIFGKADLLCRPVTDGILTNLERDQTFRVTEALASHERSVTPNTSVDITENEDIEGQNTISVDNSSILSQDPNGLQTWNLQPPQSVHPVYFRQNL